MLTKPLAIDLFCGLGGWSEGLLAEGYDVVGFDIERHRYRKIIKDHGAVKRPGMDWNGSNEPGYKAKAFNDTSDLTFSDEWEQYPGQLVLQDILTIHGSQFLNASLIVASPPCQEYSYMAMPWSRAKQKAAEIRADASGEKLRALSALFDACFRIQREACEAAGRYIPMVVENVKGAQPWVGPAKAHFGSFYLWGDVESIGGRIVAAGQVRFGAPMVAAIRGESKGRSNFHFFEKTGLASPSFHGAAHEASVRRYHEHENSQPGRSFQSSAVKASKDGAGGYGGGFGWDDTPMRRGNSKSSARKASSAQIAKIPEALSRHIARIYYPT